MKKLYIGTEPICITSSITAIKENITYLKTTISNISLSCNAGNQLKKFYLKKLKARYATLAWLIHANSVE
jgi:hypothetical protein